VERIRKKERRRNNRQEVEKMENKRDIIKMFVNNESISEKRTLKGSNLIAYYISGTQKRVLKNYSTIIALVDVNKNYNKIIINKTHYSQTTSRNQNLLRFYATQSGCEVEEIEEREIYQRLED
jgi:hypothetical protein